MTDYQLEPKAPEEFPVHRDTMPSGQLSLLYFIQHKYKCPSSNIFETTVVVNHHYRTSSKNIKIVDKTLWSEQPE